MKIKKTTFVETIPFLIKDSSQENIERISGIFKSLANDPDHSDRKINLASYAIHDDGMILFVGGLVGNYEDILTQRLSGIEPAADEIFYTTLQRARKVVSILSEEEVEAWAASSEHQFESMDFEEISEIGAY